MKLQIEKVVYGGSGLAHEKDGVEAGRTVFVPFTLPSESVEAELTTGKSDYAEASLTQVLEPSQARVKAGCIHFGSCGGCQLQHAQYDAQLAIKKNILYETLERAGLAAPAVQVHQAEPWGYRNRIRLRVETVDGTVRLGYNQRGSNEFLPIEECPIAAPLLWKAATTLLRMTETGGLVRRWFDAANEIELFCNADKSKLQMTVFIDRQISARFKEVCEKLRNLIPELIGAGVAILSKEPRRGSERLESSARWGTNGLQYAVAGIDYWVSRGGFFQVNRFLIEEMVRLVTGNRGGKLAWDLYAGVGLFSRALAKSFEQVVAVEGSEVAATDLERSMKDKGTRALHASVASFLRAAVIQRERPDLVVMDPPRAGVGAEICTLLARIGAAEMVYVSCDPVTLSRDLKSMVDSGYALVELHLIDMFPQTFHVETVAMLRR